MGFFGKLFSGGVCTSVVRLDGKIVIITGANTGIGKETAIDLAKRGAIVIMACRNVSRGETALKEVKEQSQSDQVFLKVLDLSSLRSIREFSVEFLSEYKKLDILVNNAGIMMCPYSQTEDGLESQLGVNHFGHFALTNLLLPHLVLAGTSRIVNVSSKAHKGINTMNFDDIHLERNYSPYAAYSRSKLANILFTKELHRRLSTTGVTVYALHPGVIATELTRYSAAAKFFFTLGSPFMKSVKEGAQTSIYCAVEEGIEKYSGLFFSDCALSESSAASCDEEIAKKLWDVSEKLTGVQFPLVIEREE